MYTHTHARARTYTRLPWNRRTYLDARLQVTEKDAEIDGLRSKLERGREELARALGSSLYSVVSVVTGSKRAC